MAGRPNQNARIENLEKGMAQLVGGMNSIMEKLDSKPEPEEKEIHIEPRKEVGPSHKSIGEIKLRCDLVEWLEKLVDYRNKSGERKGWTIENEIDMLVRHSKRSSDTSTAAAESRQSTLSGDARV